MAGLDPAIQAPVASGTTVVLDHRVKPGDDKDERYLLTRPSVSATRATTSFGVL